jgi:hypothetical protein
MRTFKPALSGRGVLAAAVALLSGQALAETAGRITFVNGEVTASSPDGRTRALQRGDAINGGDKISTGAGRLQIRFTDGGFVSLQPNSVFGVDEYLYANRKPEESSLFFSLLQGGMRTVTGVIGKVNKQSYKVRTPVATIGIRGTEYLASVNENGLTVSVGAGFVYVENGAGNVTAGAGQNIAVPGKDSAPALGEDKADVQASGVNGDREEEQDAEEQAADDAAGQDSLPGTVAIGNVQNASGDYLFLFNTGGSVEPFPSGPGYTAAYAFGGSPGVLGGYELPTDESLNLTFNAQGGLDKGTLASGEGPVTMFDRGATLDAGSDFIGDLKWGAWKAPTTGATSYPMVMGGSPVSLAAGDYAHYIVGRMTPLQDFLSIPAGGSATYTLQGGTLATAFGGVTGVLNPSSAITVNFGSLTSLNFNLGVDMSDGVSYLVTASASLNTLSPGFQPKFLSSTSSCSDGGASSACSASLSGFFAGAQAKQIGLAYEISDSNLGRTVKGTGAFGRGAIGSPAP